MTAKFHLPPGPQGPSSKIPIIVTSIFGLLYLWFVVVSFIPAPDGTWVNPAIPYELSRQGMIVFAFMFLLFLIGYVVVWTNELLGGIIFILWWAAMWFMETLNLAPVEVTPPGDRDGGGGIAMGFPPIHSRHSIHQVLVQGKERMLSHLRPGIQRETRQRSKLIQRSVEKKLRIN